MARPPEPDIRNRLKAKAADFMLKHGMLDLSLRPLAKALGTSARMLIYHFGSREGLIRAALDEIRMREDARVSRWYARRKEPPSLSDFLLWLCEEYTTKEVKEFAQFMVELWVLALRDPKSFPEVFHAPIAYWEMLSRKSAARADSAQTTLLLAVTRGLEIDLAATGDRRRVRKAVQLLAGMLKERGD